jgi:single-stranded-DNA-specific exonuclease
MSSWLLRPVDPDTITVLSEALGISLTAARILASRGIGDERQAREFLSPTTDGTHDPFLFREMDEAVRAVREAISAGSRILVHGDYDADGICGTAILYEGLRSIGADVHYFIPDRKKDGYGMARRITDRSLEVGLGLVITVDCGSSDGDLVRELAAGGIPVIITDHHEIGERVPEAKAFINAKLPGETYPFKELSGAGVAYKLLQGIEQGSGTDMKLSRLLDLVAVGTLGDYVSLVDENRALVTLGLAELEKWQRPGFRALRKECGLVASGFTTRQICFTIVPRLNSPGRIGSARSVVELLTTDDEDEAKAIAGRIEDTNRQRRAHDGQVTEEACYLADIMLKRKEPNALVFSSSSWHEGVVGIGAARLAENYGIPSVLIAVRDGVGKGSVRSSGGINIRDALEKCSKYLPAFGGHKEAGGFSIREEDIPAFNNCFNKVVGEAAGERDGQSHIYADAEISLSECDLGLISFIERLAPFGPGNIEPLVLIRDLDVLDRTRIVGKHHLRLAVSHEGGGSLEMIGFSLGKSWKPFDVIGGKIDVLAHLRRNVWQGKEEAQIQVTLIHRTEEPAALREDR